METNYVIVISTALIPMIIGVIWYHPAVMGNAWMNASGVTPDQAKSGNMAIIFGVSILFSLMLATMIPALVIHQSGMVSMMMSEQGVPGNEMSNPDFKYMFDKYGHNYRTFKHGVFHGVISSLFFALPILGIMAMVERRNAKYIFIHLGYWIVTLALMGGVVCQWA